MREGYSSSFELSVSFLTSEQDQALDEILHSAGEISEAEIRARMARVGFTQHHTDDVVTAVEWLVDDPLLSSMDDAMHWRPEPG